MIRMLNFTLLNFTKVFDFIALLPNIDVYTLEFPELANQKLLTCK